MANEFIARNGLIAQNNSTISGSLIVTNGITGSILGTATSASYVNSLMQTVTITGSVNISSSNASQLVVGGASNNLTVNYNATNGNWVGIGTSTVYSYIKNVALVVQGNTNDGYATIALKNTNPLIKWIGSYNGGNGAELYQNGSGTFLLAVNSSTYGFSIYSDGSSMFGAQGGSKISFSNTVVPASALGKVHITGNGATSGTNALYIENSTPTNLLTVRNDGNVGIGTSSPATLLHVNGTTRIDNAGSTPSTSPAGPPANMYYGSGGNNYLSDPSVWLKINVGGTDYVFPGY